MSAIQQLLTDHLDIWTAADIAKKSGRGRSSGNAASVYGIKKLRELILELAVRGKLVPQDANDEPASELLKKIATEKAKLVAEGKIKKSKPLAEITDNEKPFELPTGWEWAKLGEITNFGITEKLGFISDETWVLDLEDIEKDTSRLLNKKSFCDRRSLSDKNSFQEGDVLYGKLRPYLNKVIVADESGVCTTEIFPIRCYGSFSSHYFKYALKSPYFINYVNARSYGMKMPRLGTEDGRKANFPLPPLAEQHRIVAKVDELMALCDQLENQHNNAAVAHEKLVTQLLGTLTQSQNTEDFNTNWQRISEYFDTLFTTEASIDALKQTLLQLAVMGKLVPQDPNDEPASELLKRIQAEKAKLIAEGKIKKAKPLAEITEEEKPFDLPVGWEWIRVSTIAEIITSGSRDWAKHLSNEGAKFITMGNLSRGSYNLRLENMRYVNPPEDGEGSRTKLKEDDLLISITGDVGNLGRIPENFGDAYINQHTCLLRFISDCRNRYFPETLRSPMAISQFIEPQRGIKNSFRLGDLAEMVIPLPPKNEQHRIVAKVDELMAICDHLKSKITSANQLQQKLADVLVAQSINFKN
jgi:type I restriction enzyme, S subunit